jgi:co-chaperonin GroES (HSP10)
MAGNWKPVSLLHNAGIIPDTAKEKPQGGTVAAVGTGKLDDNGKKIEFTVKVGDKVLISKYGGTEIKIDGENYLIMREDDILGGVAYLRTQKALGNIKLEGDEAVGAEIVRRAIEFPTRQLANNAGQEGALIVQEVKNRRGNEGFNVATGKYEDLVKAGVVDPTKVTRTALQNAALMLTTEALVTEMPEKEKPASGGMGGMDY